MEQLFRVSFKKIEKTFRRAKYYQYEINDLTGNCGLRSRLHDVEKINLYLRRNCEFESFLDLCEEAIATIKMMQDDNTLSKTITPRDLSRISLLHAMMEAVKTRSTNFRCVKFQKKLILFVK